MRRQAVRYVILGQLIFIITIISCVLIAPHIISDNKALSVYGSTRATFPLFVLGLLAVAGTLFKAAKLLPHQQPPDRTLAILLTIIGTLMVGLAITPLGVNETFYTIHFALASILGLVNLGTGFWLLTHARQDFINYLLFGLELIGGVVCILSTDEVNLLDVMATGQIVAIFAFALLITRAVPQIEHIKAKSIF
jgi:hypothetical protein